jgi:hypothetical protein
MTLARRQRAEEVVGLYLDLGYSQLPTLEISYLVDCRRPILPSPGISAYPLLLMPISCYAQHWQIKYRLRPLSQAENQGKSSPWYFFALVDKVPVR